MKNLTLTTVITIFLSLSSLFAKSSNSGTYPGDSLDFLEIEGKISNIMEGVKGHCKIDLFHANKVVDSMTLKKGKKKFTFYLKKNAYYTIRISKEGFADRLVCVNTSVPKKFEEEIHSFQFTTELLSKEESSKLDTQTLDFPIAIIYFDKGKHCFNPAKEYTKSIKRELFSSIAAQ